MNASLRWTLVAFVVLVGVVVALFTTIGGPDDDDGNPLAGGADTTLSPQAAPPVGGAPADEPMTVVEPEVRATAGLPECRDAGAAATTDGPVAGLMVRCMNDGSTTTLGKIQAGRPMVGNMWAYWCEPGRRELPAVRDAAAALGDRVRVVMGDDVVEDLIREVQITLSGAAETVTPVIGGAGYSADDLLAETYRTINNLEERLQRLEAI